MSVHANMCMHLAQKAGLSYHCLKGLGGLAVSRAVWAGADCVPWPFSVLPASLRYKPGFKSSTMAIPSGRFYSNLGKVSVLDTRNLSVPHATEVSPSTVYFGLD